MIQIYLSNIHSHEETSELSESDEPYVLVTAVDLTSRVPIAGFPVSLPAFEVVIYGPFEGVDDEETHFAPGIAQSFWGVNGRPAALANPDQAIFVVALMEHDAGRPGTLRAIVKGIVGGSVLGSLALGLQCRICPGRAAIRASVARSCVLALLHEAPGIRTAPAHCAARPPGGVIRDATVPP